MSTAIVTAQTNDITILAAKLSAAQSQLKARYREDPLAAQLVLNATGNVVQKEIACDVDTHIGVARTGLHPATGGDGSLACSGDMLLQALIGCAGVTLAAVATAIGVTLHKTEAHAGGDLDFRGTLGVDKTAPVEFTAIRVTFRVDCDATDAQLETLKKLTERYCVVAQTLAKGVEVTMNFERL
jgi:uncharacterized OsmC-like protein